ncbi:heptaprenyl diphosphate synthase component 1 [Sporosarcina limicola]|uniref:Heptaprenyl diphosphate synthase n=1 Tax=Sporosarcina limicola TaxID=34101 RepID=A0A927MGQ7_9BACL|nr:heptaprenyl diphosphate synthase component 1 [Sporosarcina limicola]MBE1554110.1 heptaprenyl diphosphate synthase [Sporosarcina limicola]
MEKQKMKQYIENYISEVERSIYEPIVNRDVRCITVDDVKAFFLLLPMLNGEKWTSSMNTAAIAIGAVHAAFDAHDRIDLSDATTKQQQLTVLSGDHFSGIHYRLLASQSEYKFIRSLSKTIGAINEMKTIFHEQLPDGPGKLIEAVRVIEAGCITNFLHTFGFMQYIPLANAVLPLLKLDKGFSKHKLELSTYGRPDRTLDTAFVDQAIVLLMTELQVAIVEADFLKPFFQQEIRNMAIPLFDKPI